MFRTEVFPLKEDVIIDYSSSIITLGSCFANVIGSFFSKYKFNAYTNPFGISYNPVSIFNLFNEQSLLDPQFFLSKEGLYSSYLLHSDVVERSQFELTDKIKNISSRLSSFSERSDIIIFTFGTAYVYRMKKSERIITSCHKMPSDLFTKELLSVDTILREFDLWQTKINQNRKTPPTILLTVSPVRHIKDSMVLNNVSKSILRVACHELAKSDRVFYFPSYEIMMDDLRDYRFYKEDMIHPSEVAHRYIWEKFVATFMEKETQAKIHKVEEILKACDHIPFHPHTPSHQKFLRQTILKMEGLKDIDLTRERNHLQQQLID